MLDSRALRVDSHVSPELTGVGDRRGRKPLLTAALAAAAGLCLVATQALTLSDRKPASEVTARPMAAASSEETQRAASAFGRLPLAFIPNAGQTDGRARLYTQGRDYGFYFTADSAVLTLQKQIDGKDEGLALELRFLGANSMPAIEGIDKGTGTVSYFKGRDPSGWHTGLPTYEGVAYRDLWPGIDMVFRGRDGRLKYEFRLAPGADPRQIGLAYAGAQSISLTSAGGLTIGTPLGMLADAAPVAYQLVDGRQTPVTSRYILGKQVGGGSGYGFAVGTYDPRYPLVIDPGLAYSTFLGGTGSDTPFAVALDEEANAYITGFTTSANFPTTPGAFDPTANGAVDAFVTKLNADGSVLVYSTYIGSAGFDFAADIDVDEHGNAYVVGVTDGSDFPTTRGAFQQTDPLVGPSPEGDDGFVVKLDRLGKRLVYSTYLGGPGEDSANGVAVDDEGNAYVGSAGATSAFPTTPGAFMETDPGPGPAVCPDPNADDPEECIITIGQDAMASKLNRSGSALVYATYLGGSSRDILNSMTVDNRGRFYAGGATDSTNFPTTPGAFMPEDPQPVPVGPSTQPESGPDGFVTRLNQDGTDLEYSTYLGGTGGAPGGSGEGVIAIGVDRGGHAYVSGRTDSAFDFPVTSNAYDTSYNGADNDSFVTKFNAAGSGLVYSTFLGGNGFDQSGFAVAIDRGGRASVVGITNSTNFPTTGSAVQPTKSGGFDGYVTTLNESGSNLIYSTYLGGSATDAANGIAVDPHANLYVTGRTGSANFPTTPGAYDTTFNGGGRDAFVTKVIIE
jgi:beta-propeller repeat-containing protein